MKLFRYLEASPIIELQKTTSDIRLSYNTVSNAARRLETAGILKPSGSSRNRTWAYEKYLDILKRGTY